MEKTKMPKEIAFEFQEIPLHEAINAVIAGDGNYTEVKERLLTILPEIERRNQEGGDRKAFAFGLPNGKEVPEDQRRGLCMAINATLRKATVGWHLTYSSNRKLFICVPHSYNRKPVRESRSLATVRATQTNDTSQKNVTLEHIEATVVKVFDITIESIMRKGRIPYYQSRIRNAIIYLAYRKYGISSIDILARYPISGASIKNMNRNIGKITDQIKQIEAAL